MAQHVVAPGESWASIAGSELGDQRQLWNLANLNGGVQRLLHPGDVIDLPDAPTAGQGSPFVSQSQFADTPRGYSQTGQAQYGPQTATQTAPTRGGAGTGPALPNFGGPALPSFGGAAVGGPAGYGVGANAATPGTPYTPGGNRGLRVPGSVRYSNRANTGAPVNAPNLGNNPGNPNAAGYNRPAPASNAAGGGADVYPLADPRMWAGYQPGYLPPAMVAAGNPSANAFTGYQQGYLPPAMVASANLNAQPFAGYRQGYLPPGWQANPEAMARQYQFGYLPPGWQANPEAANRQYSFGYLPPSWPGANAAAAAAANVSNWGVPQSAANRGGASAGVPPPTSVTPGANPNAPGGSPARANVAMDARYTAEAIYAFGGGYGPAWRGNRQYLPVIITGAVANELPLPPEFRGNTPAFMAAIGYTPDAQGNWNRQDPLRNQGYGGGAYNAQTRVSAPRSYQGRGYGYGGHPGRASSVIGGGGGGGSAGPRMGLVAWKISA